MFTKTVCATCQQRLWMDGAERDDSGRLRVVWVHKATADHDPEPVSVPLTDIR